MLLLSCQPELGIVREQPDPDPQTKSLSGERPEDFQVSLSDAKAYSELRYPDKAYEVIPYVTGRDTLMYVFNYGKGWLVISGDKRVDPVVADSEDGTLDIYEDSQHAFYLRDFAADIAKMRKDPKASEVEKSSLWDVLPPSGKPCLLQTKSSSIRWKVETFTMYNTCRWEEIVEPLIQTKWGQGDPWNQKLPRDSRTEIPGVLTDGKRCATGCVSVAVSQMLYYLHYRNGFPHALYHDISCSIPTIVAATQNIGFSRASLVQHSPRWDEMESLTNPYGSTMYVGDLMLDVGNRYNTMYSSEDQGGSSAYMSNVWVLLYYGLICYSRDFYTMTVTDQLDSGMPVIVTADNDSRQISHAWIIDGYCRERTTYQKLRVCYPTDQWSYYDETYGSLEEAQRIYSGIQEGIPQYYEEDKNVYYFYMNWGEDGAGDSARYRVNADWTFNGVVYGDNKTMYYDFREL